MSYATVIIGSSPTNLGAVLNEGVGGVILPLTCGAIPTKLTAPATPLTVPAKTIFKTPPSLYIVPTL